jgi:hypothetical protein
MVFPDWACSWLMKSFRVEQVRRAERRLAVLRMPDEDLLQLSRDAKAEHQAPASDYSAALPGRRRRRVSSLG